MKRGIRRGSDLVSPGGRDPIRPCRLGQGCVCGSDPCGSDFCGTGFSGSDPVGGDPGASDPSGSDPRGTGVCGTGFCGTDPCDTGFCGGNPGGRHPRARGHVCGFIARICVAVCFAAQPDRLGR
jgi:hypothetical protein